MAPMAASLAQSESKAKFMKRIGLDESNKIHRLLYSKMKDEAVEGWIRMTSTRDALVPCLVDDLTVNPPYSYAQINETAMRTEVIKIYEQACPETKILYNLGHDSSMPPDENWIIRWFLWHVFRYRDERNSVLNRIRTFHSGDVKVYTKQRPIPSKLPPAQPPAYTQPSIDSTALQLANCSVSQAQYWDPVRETFRG